MFDFFVGDGPYHTAAVHNTKKSGKIYPTQHFYPVDLHNQALIHLSLVGTSGNRKRQHDARAIKRLDKDTLCKSAPMEVWRRHLFEYQIFS
jgi:hypothetical protein